MNIMRLHAFILCSIGFWYKVRSVLLLLLYQNHASFVRDTKEALNKKLSDNYGEFYALFKT